MGDLDPHLIHGSWAKPSPQPKRHLEQFSRFFAGLTSITERLTDRSTEHATRSVTMGRIYIRTGSTAMWLKNSDDVINSTYTVFGKNIPLYFLL